MPSYPPKGFTPGAMTFHNGMPSRSSHAVEIDRYTAWLASVYRPNVPALIGSPWVAGPTYSIRTRMPHYCESVAFGFFCLGSGTITASNSDDSYTALYTIEALPSSYGTPEPFWFQTPLASVAIDDVERAMDIADQSSPHDVTFEFEVSDTLEVYQVIVYPLPRTSATELPA